MYFLGFIFLKLLSLNYGQFIDINSPYLKSLQENKHELFGFSLGYFRNTKTNQNFILGGAINGTTAIAGSGAAYVCPLSNQEHDCKLINIQKARKQSLLGFSIGSNDLVDYFYVCAPNNQHSYKSRILLEGDCYLIDSTFQMKDELYSQSCKELMMKDTSTLELINCLFGGAINILDKTKLLISSPYANRGKGAISYFVADQEINYVLMDKMLDIYQLVGYSMATGKLINGPSFKYTVVSGGPSISLRYQRDDYAGHGVVAIGTIDGENLKMHGLIMGGRFGVGFGSSVLLVDIDKDGVDDLIVGAPYDDRAIGCVYVFWSNGTTEFRDNEMKTNDNTKYIKGDHNSIPLSLKTPTILKPTSNINTIEIGIRFGLAIEKIGDINKDGIEDFVVGAPFEDKGKGCIYIYLGSKTHDLPVSQKICGKQMTQNVKGLGISLHGGGKLDLDSNNYPDFLVAAMYSNHVYGLRSKPLIKLYLDIKRAPEGNLSFDLRELKKCKMRTSMKYCVEFTMKVFYHHLISQSCSASRDPIEVSYKIELDKEFRKKNGYSRVLLSNQLSTMKGNTRVLCKEISKEFDASLDDVKWSLVFPSIHFLTLSTPITFDIAFKYEAKLVPKRTPGGKIADLALYPLISNIKKTFLHKVYFGKGCSPTECKPFLDLKVTPLLKKVSNEYVLYIKDKSTFKMKVILTNKARGSNNKAIQTYLKVAYDNRIMKLNEITPNLVKKSNPKKLNDLVAIDKNLGPRESMEIELEFKLSDIFLEKGDLYIYVNISAHTIVPQPHLTPIITKIKTKMNVNFDIQARWFPDTVQYRKVKIKGSSDIKTEFDIGSKLVLDVSIENRDKISRVMSSKLVLFIPWEIAGNTTEKHGQFLLYLTKTPKFMNTTTRKTVVCDSKFLNKHVNYLGKTVKNIKIEKYSDVTSKEVEIPNNLVKFPRLANHIIYKETKRSKEFSAKTALLSCKDGTTRCVPLVCDIGVLSRKSGRLNMKLEFRLWVYTLVEKFLIYPFVQIEIPIYWIPTAKYEIVSESSNSFHKTFTGQLIQASVIAFNKHIIDRPSDNRMVIHIVIAVGVGIIVLTIIVIVLYQLKFFQRESFNRPSRLFSDEDTATS